MSSSRFVQHVTLDTGHVRRSPRSEVADHVVTMLIGWLDQALAGAPVDMPGCDAVLTAQSRGKCLVVEITDSRTLDALATIGIALHSRCGGPLWRELHRDARGTATSPDRAPAEPWVAARLRPHLAQRMDAAGWLGDLERCLAWAWIDRRAGQTGDGGSSSPEGGISSP